MSNGYENLNVFKKAYQLSLQIYEVTKSFPEDERFGLTSQMRRASVSIFSNLGEGYSKSYLKDFIRYTSNSIGSSNELEIYIKFSYDLNYLEKNL